MYYIIFFISVYLLSTIEEWLAHKYIMHTKSNVFKKIYDNHLLHHVKTQKNYTIIDNNPDYICFDILSMDGLVQCVVLFTVNYGFLYMLFHNYVSSYAISATIILFIMINVLVWNTFHSYIHGMDAYEICIPKGVPRKYINEDNFYVKWVLNNHRAHHDNNTGNYNIVFPGADFFVAWMFKR